MTAPLNSLSLFNRDLPSSPNNPTFHEAHTTQLGAKRLWIAIRLPRIALESLPDINPQGVVVVVGSQQGHHRVIVASRNALKQGIKPGLKLSAAYALSDSLHVLERCPEAEHAVLEGVARWLRQFTPSVSLSSSQELLMEVYGSLKLFGGLEPIKTALRAELRRRRMTAFLCVAPTALAALWLARNESKDVYSPGKLVGNVGVLPLEVTGWPSNILASLQSMGVQTIGDCLRLPRDGFIRRIGRQYLLQLEKSLGAYDPWPVFQSPQRLRSILELPDEITDPVVLACAGERLIESLVKVLRKRQIGIERFEILLKHMHRSSTAMHIKLSDPSQDRERFLRLFLDKLERVVLPAPVIALTMRTGRVEPTTGRNKTLFEDSVQSGMEDAINGLVERLRGRFGAARIYGISLVAEHRPEAAWAQSADSFLEKNSKPSPISPWAHYRPLWILPNPMPLALTTDCLPRYRDHEPLHRQFGPERIEAGWWSDEEISRDYYTASNRRGEKLWIYQDRYADRCWFLHGFFG
jgi:protein ImuB